MAFLQVVCPNHVNLSNFRSEPLSRLNNLKVGIYDPTFKSIWSRHLGNLFNIGSRIFNVNNCNLFNVNIFNFNVNNCCVVKSEFVLLGYLISELGSTAVQKCRGAVTRYFLVPLSVPSILLKNCTVFGTVVTF